MIRMAILTVHFSHIRCERAQPYMVQSRIYIYRCNGRSGIELPFYVCDACDVMSSICRRLRYGSTNAFCMQRGLCE